MDLFNETSGFWQGYLAFSRMTAVTVEWGPGNLAIMTFSTKLTLNNLNHINFVSPGPHFKDRGMADLTFEPDSMKPMGKYNRRHAGLGCLTIECNITIFCLRCGGEIEKNEQSGDKEDKQ